MSTTAMTRRDLMRKGAVAAVGTAAVTIPLSSAATAADDGRAEGRGHDALGGICQLRVAFHRAKNDQIDLKVSLWAKDATFQLGGTTYAGRHAVWAFFLGTGSWHHHLTSPVPSFKDQVYVRDDGTASLYFERHDVALTDESTAALAGSVVTHLRRPSSSSLTAPECRRCEGTAKPSTSLTTQRAHTQEDIRRPELRAAHPSSARTRSRQRHGIPTFRTDTPSSPSDLEWILQRA